MPRSKMTGPEGSPFPPDTSRRRPANRRRLSGPGLRTFLAIADTWKLTGGQRRQILGDLSRSTFQRWSKKAREHREITLSVDVLTRISLILGIYSGLVKLFAADYEGIAWLRRPHGARVFNGVAPIDLIVSGVLDDLITVRCFIDAAGTGLYMAPTADEENFLPYQDREIIFEECEGSGEVLLAAGLRTFFKLADEWHLNEAQQTILLGSPASAKLQDWRRGVISSANGETLERISYCLGIYKAIHLLLQDSARTENWLRAPNDAPLFAGRSALDKMLSGELVDLANVRAYLDAQLQ